MDKEELSELLKTGEGLTLEFKENVSSHLGKEICAFANSKGGRIILGVKDNGNILGIKTTNALKSQIQTFARNIDPVFSVETDEVEKVGSGIGRIQDSMRNYGLGVEFKSTGFFTVIFKRPHTPQITPQIDLTQLEQGIIELIKKDNKITRRLISKQLKIGEDTVKEYLSKLRKKGVLKRVGTKGGHWEVLR